MGRIGLTGSEQNNITSNDSALAIANESAEVSQKERVKPYKRIGKNCPMPPSIIKPPTARLTSRTAKKELRVRS